MDPKLSNLDPKLQDAYNRVMGSPPAGSGNMPPPGPQVQTPSPDPALAPPPGPGPDPLASQNPAITATPNSFSGPTPPPVSPDPALSPPIVQDITPPPPPMDPTPPPVEPAPMPPPVMPTEPTPPPPAPAVVESSPAPTPVEAVPQPSSNLPPGSIPGVNATVAFNATNSDKNVGTTPVKKGGIHIMPIVVGLGIIVLLVAYTFVWIVLFNVKVPFLPQL